MLRAIKRGDAMSHLTWQPPLTWGGMEEEHLGYFPQPANGRVDR